MPSWLSYFIGAVIAVLVALLLAPVIPSPGDQLVAIVAWIAAVILAILGIVALVRSPRV